ncbi:hypothetical protein PanWU01x14_332630 [Parasponia andersonii]|uniref:Uncharacterized protein n=1 Tax=Parasponia andersonii TaxID=3476 RepID=A0A2P5AHA8_PARAD|nr:hypothetical protein PanWU01x14_332630 [Parasponia andersonii]
MANTRNTTRAAGTSQNHPQSTAATEQPAMTATEDLSRRQDRMEETLVNLQQVTNQINDTLRRLAEGQMVTPP